MTGESRRRLLGKGIEKGRLRVSEKKGGTYTALLILGKGPDSERRL